MHEHRRELLSGLSGRVLEVGAGAGTNFEHYPPGVSEVIAVEPERFLRERARVAASRAAVAITVLDGVAEQLPVEDGCCDAAVASLMLCSVPDQAVALAELRRVLRPRGELRFYEHVLSHDPRIARTQHFVDRTFWPTAFGGCPPLVTPPLRSKLPGLRSSRSEGCGWRRFRSWSRSRRTYSERPAADKNGPGGIPRQWRRWIGPGRVEQHAMPGTRASHRDA